MKRREAFPRITPVRALDLLRLLDKARHVVEKTDARWEHDQITTALYNHVRAALVRRKR